MTTKFGEPIQPQGQEPKTENADTTQAIALLQNSALDKLDEVITADGRSTEELLRKLDEAKQANDYNTRRDLTEALRQRLDMADMRGQERPKEILDALASVYTSDEYSKVRQDIMMSEIPKDNPDVLAHALLDKRFTNSNSLLYSLEDKEIREKIYQALKTNNAVDKAVTLVSTTKDLAAKVPLFEDLAAWLQQNSSNEAKKAKDSYGGYNRLRQEVAFALLNQERETFNRLLGNGTINIEGLEDCLKDEPEESLINTLMHVITIDDASRVIKFMQSKEILLTTIPELEHSALPSESRLVVAANMQRLAASFDAPPKIRSLGQLQKKNESKPSYTVPNKFIVALRDGDDQATIAWSNTEIFYEHKQLAESIRNVSTALCAGGQIELITAEDGHLQVVFLGRSGAFGPYNKTFLEGFKQAITENLQHEFGLDVEVVIQPSEIN